MYFNITLRAKSLVHNFFGTDFVNIKVSTILFIR